MRIYILKLAFVLLFALSLVLNLNAQELTSNFLSDNSKLLMSYDDSFELSEENFLLPAISKVSINNNEQIAVYGKGLESIILFSSRGKKAIPIGSKGRGPFEFSKLGTFKLTNNNIYTWDKDLLKLSKFSLAGDKLLEVQDFRWAVKYIEPIRNQVFLYETGSISSKGYLQSYDITNNEFGSKYGNQNQTHILLNFNASSGSLTSLDNEVYFTSPSLLEINIINLENEENDKVEKINFNDESFIVPNIKSAREELAKGTENINELLMKSSYVTNIFALKDYLVVMAQIGESSYNNELKVYTAENRKIRFYVIDYSSKSLVDTFTFSVAANKKVQDSIWTSTNTDLVFLSSYNFFDTHPHNQSTKVYFFNILKVDE